MRQRRASSRAQRGIALLGLLAVIVMVFAWILTSRLNAANQHVALDRDHNARVMSRAKAALIGFVAQQASLASENNPGSLPCPEAPANFGVPAQEGIAAGNCTLPAVGRLPWRTLGLERLVDASGEPLWYVVSPDWAMPNSTTPTVINPDSVGKLTVDGVSDDAVALIVAPGPAIALGTSGGCTAWSQARPATGAPDKRNYLECGNAANSFVGSSTNPAFNDQILRVTTADIMPGLEAAIQERTQREIAPALRSVYALDSNSPRRWVASSTNPVYPYAAVFANPNPGPSTPPATFNNYEGSATTYQGLLPFVRTQGCTPGTDERCTTLSWTGSSSSVTAIGGVGTLYPPSCSGSTVRVCTGQFEEDSSNQWGAGIRLEMTATVSNVAMGLRSLDWSKAQVHARNMDPDPWQAVALEPFPDTRAVMNADGSVTVRIRARLPVIEAMSWGTWAEYRVTLDKAVISDHALLDTSTSNPLGWFARNQWFRSTYYAVAQASTAGGSSNGCNNTNCLRFNEGLGCGSGADWCNIRALLVLGGASLSGASRPNGNLADYVEYTNGDGGTFYEQHAIRRPTNVAIANGPWNDRVVLVDWLPSLPPLLTGTHPQVASVSPLRVYVLP